MLRSARVRREAYVGEWLPEPLVDAEAPRAVERIQDHGLAAELADDLRTAPGGPGDVVAALDEHGDEAAAEGASGAPEEDA